MPCGPTQPMLIPKTSHGEGAKDMFQLSAAPDEGHPPCKSNKMAARSEGAKDVLQLGAA